MPLALKYRPAKLEDVVGQRDAVSVIKSVGTTKKDIKVVMLAGQHGIGKTSLARLLAKLLNCEAVAAGSKDACGVCKSCELMTENRHPDYIEQDMGSRGLIADVRRMIAEASMKPSWRNRVFVLDECHAASREAFSALLKVLEEGPRTATFVLCTTAMDQVPYAIVSRSLVLRLQPLRVTEIQKRIADVARKEGVTISDDAVEALAKSCSGSMRDCYMSMDRLLAQTENNEITMDILKGEHWYNAVRTAPLILKSLMSRERDDYLTAQEVLSSRLSFEIMIRETLDLVCRLYVKRGRRPDKITDALWDGYVRLSRGLDPELIMEGIWVATN